MWVGFMLGCMAAAGLGEANSFAEGVEEGAPAGPQSTTLADAEELSGTTHSSKISGFPKKKRESPADGRWKNLRPGPPRSELTQEESEMLEKLRSIGYVGGSIKDKRQGVVRYLHDRATPGLNFYSSGHAPVAILMDMDGKLLHQWQSSYKEIFPSEPAGRSRKKQAQWWRRVRLLDDGSILAIFEGRGIVKLDRDSNIVWARSNQAHHDIEVLPNGDIYVLTRRARMASGPSGTVPLLEDFLTLLDSSGNEKWSVSILEALEASHPEFLEQGKRRGGDILHTNTIHVLGPNNAGPAFAPGNVLMSMNALGLITVLDPLGKILTWVRKTPPQGQHDPKMLENGNILFFDNREEAGASAVLEIHPATNREEWQYIGSQEEPFYSEFCGAAERLPSGNTLISESDGGRAFEVDPGGDIVWEFFNPHRAGDQGDYIAAISEMVRLPASATKSWLNSKSIK